MPCFYIAKRNRKRHTIQILTRHPIYYFPEGDLFIIVQQTQFRIHSYFLLRESTHFQQLLNPFSSFLPTTPGISAARPLILNDTSSRNFAIFLWVFYTPHFGRYQHSLHNWLIIHTYAIRWEFPIIQQLAEQHIIKHC